VYVRIANPTPMKARLQMTRVAIRMTCRLRMADGLVQGRNPRSARVEDVVG
jgi:hypothetical protein